MFCFLKVDRESYHFDGFVVGDCGAVANIFNNHNYTRTAEEAVGAALHAGTDLDCGVYYSLHTIDALKKGSIDLTKNNVDIFGARQLSLESAQQNLILLKNVNKALPLNLDQLMNKKIALIEPTANAIILM